MVQTLVGQTEPARPRRPGGAPAVTGPERFHARLRNARLLRRWRRDASHSPASSFPRGPVCLRVSGAVAPSAAQPRLRSLPRGSSMAGVGPASREPAPSNGNIERNRSGSTAPRGGNARRVQAGAQRGNRQRGSHPSTQVASTQVASTQVASTQVSSAPGPRQAGPRQTGLRPSTAPTPGPPASGPPERRHMRQGAIRKTGRGGRLRARCAKATGYRPTRGPHSHRAEALAARAPMRHLVSTGAAGQRA